MDAGFELENKEKYFRAIHVNIVRANYADFSKISTNLLIASQRPRKHIKNADQKETLPGTLRGA